MGNFTFTATGDSIITRRVSQRKDPAFLEMLQLIRSVDAAFTNLELMTPQAPFVPSSEYGGMHLSAPPFVLDELQWCGFNLYHIAHNHATDYMYQGLVDTIDQLRLRNMVYAGGGRNLGEARSPGYLETAAGRVALIGAASSYVTGALAAESRTDVGGRPGISPLRYATEFVLDAERMAALADIDKALGTAAVTARNRVFGIRPEEQPDAYHFLGRQFVEGKEPAVRTKPKQRDLEEIAHWIAEARRQADFVVASLHCHEGQNTDGNSAEPADFIIETAHRWIDAGADAFIGHGPHMLRGIEIYKGKPIFYSLGNFMFMFETVQRFPSEMYEAQKLPPTATPTDVADAWSQHENGTAKGFHADTAFWQSVLPICKFEGGKLAALELHPITLGLARPRTERGEPTLAGSEEGTAILDRLAQLSAPFGTRLTVEKAGNRVMGRVTL
ncbi:MAG: poly-gamma-glutamate biosynthesis protein [Firmicutes bacterium]|nr:poly-gamma-glutamate biosynthesis protein [Bacillota bacterium]